MQKVPVDLFCRIEHNITSKWGRFGFDVVIEASVARRGLPVGLDNHPGKDINADEQLALAA